MEFASPFGGDDEITIGTDTVVVTDEDFAPHTLFSCEIENTGSVALTAAKIQRKMAGDGEWKDFFGAADWSSTTNTAIKFISTVKPNTLAASAKCDFGIYCDGAVAVRLLLTADTGGTTVVVKGNMQ